MYEQTLKERIIYPHAYLCRQIVIHVYKNNNIDGHTYIYIYIFLSILIISIWSNSHRIVVIFRVTRFLIQLICFRRGVVCDVCMVCMLLRSMWRRSDPRDIFRYLEYAARRYSCFPCNNCLYLLAP
jgi:hypothetical protein